MRIKKVIDEVTTEQMGEVKIKKVNCSKTFKKIIVNKYISRYISNIFE